jgi:hypothetical protein
MASLKSIALVLSLSLASVATALPVAEAAPEAAPQGFEPPGGPCWSNEDCYRAYFCSFPIEGQQGMCTYG